MIGETWFWALAALVFGINIGSFLNVVIWRLPRGGSLIAPQYSYCPSCTRRLTFVDLIPLFSFLFLGRKCRTCRKPISWRYFCVELLTGLLFLGIALRYPHHPVDAVSLILFTALLVPISGIDLEFFMIPPSLNALVFVIAIARDVWGIVQHEPAHALVWGWCPRSVIGAIVGISIFGIVRLAGWIWKRQEAMGLGDVILARAMGAMLVQLAPAGASMFRLFPAWFLFSCFTGMLMGIPIILMRVKREEAEDQANANDKSKTVSNQDSPREVGGRPAASNTELQQGNIRRKVEQTVDPIDAEIEDEPSSLREQLLDIVYCLALVDIYEYLHIAVKRFQGAPATDATEPTIEEEEFTPQPTAIPFGPFLAVGFLATVYFGEALTAAYLAFAYPKP